MWAPLLFVVCLLAGRAGALPPGRSLRARRDASNRIVGGWPVDISEFPWQVSVLWYDRHICGGSIISPEWVLTAGHCIFDCKRRYEVRVGSSKRNQDGTVYAVADLIVHSNFNWDLVDYDIGLVKIRGQMSMSDKVQTVNLATFEAVAGTSVTVTGWGSTETGLFPRELQAVTVEIQERSSCNTSYGGGITERMICAGVEEGGKDSCSGDSGGPLVAGNTQHGIVSWGWGCGLPGHPGVYTSVAALRSWIREKTGV